jgi:hypothetical protein
MTPTPADLERVACKLWGEPNRALSSRYELRFGAHGSKSVDLREFRWFNHVLGEGGGYQKLCELAGEPIPERGDGMAATYDYRNEKGALLFQVVRMAGKQFWQRRPDGNSGWVRDLQGLRRVLYRLPELLAAQPGSTVFIVEGEKDVENLREWLLVATCNPGGAVEHTNKSNSYKGKWRAEYGDCLRGHHVVILPDNDGAGEDHALDVARHLHGVAASVCILRLPDLPPKGDVSDWFAAGGTAETLLELVRAEKAAPAQLKQFDDDIDISVLRLNRRPPHLWKASVGDSGAGKSPGSNGLFSHVLPEIERRMIGDFPERLREWQTSAELATAKLEAWQMDVRQARKTGHAPPVRTNDTDAGPEPQQPRLQQHDVTIEKVAQLLATAAPKGLLMVRDELAGFLLGMGAYNDAARPFWLEAYGGRPYRVERMKHAVPVEVPRLSVSWFGTIQPERLAQVMVDVDDGLPARFEWVWPELIAFNAATRIRDIEIANRALDRLRLLEMTRSKDGRLFPAYVQLEPTASEHMVVFARDMQRRQEFTEGLLRSSYGKARGMALRLALIVEFMRWCGKDGIDPPPPTISESAFSAAATWVSEYSLPMATRVFGDVACNKADRDIATLARWIAQEHPSEVHVRTMQRVVRLQGLIDAESIHAACVGLIDAGWLLSAPRAHGIDRNRAAYPVNPRLGGVLP